MSTDFSVRWSMIDTWVWVTSGHRTSSSAPDSWSRYVYWTVYIHIYIYVFVVVFLLLGDFRHSVCQRLMSFLSALTTTHRGHVARDPFRPYRFLHFSFRAAIARVTLCLLNTFSLKHWCLIVPLCKSKKKKNGAFCITNINNTGVVFRACAFSKICSRSECQRK